MHKRVLIFHFLLTLIISSCSFAGFGGDSSVTQTVISATKMPATPSETVLTPGEMTSPTPDYPVDETSPVTSSPVPPPDTPTPSPTAGPKYIVQAGTPLELRNFIDMSAGCEWMGIGGQVFDTAGSPLNEFIIEVGGSMGGRELLKMGITGDTPALGLGGYSIKLSDQPIDTEGTFWLQLFGLNGTPLSETIYFSTYKDCDKNFILINLVERPPGYRLRAVIPLILKYNPNP